MTELATTGKIVEKSEEPLKMRKIFKKLYTLPTRFDLERTVFILLLVLL
jgi:hypothetical protein